MRGAGCAVLGARCWVRGAGCAALGARRWVRGVTEILHDYRLVSDPAALERAGLFVAEGRLVVERLLADGRYRVHSVLVTSSAAAALESALSMRRDVSVFVREPAVMEGLTGFDFHRGCLALAYRREPTVPIDELCQAARILAIEGVANPDNVGGLFRAAFALGVDVAMLDSKTADPLYRKAIRTSMAATLRVPYSRVGDWAATFDQLRSCGFRVLALTPHGDAIPLHDVRVAPGSRLVIAVGSEGDGLTPRVLDHVDQKVRIPIDPRADSLNVVVAASIAMQALRP